MIQGVLFDMDGLMFDTERIGYEGWKYAGKKLGIHMKDELIASFRGTGEKEKRRHFKEAEVVKEKKHLEVKSCMMKHLRFGRYMQKNGSIRMGFR